MNFQTINPKKIFDALQWLKDNNKFYSNTRILPIRQWIEDSQKMDKDNVLEQLLCDDPNVEKEYEDLADVESESEDEGEGREDMMGF